MIDVSRWTVEQCERSIAAASELKRQDVSLGRSRSADEQERIDMHILNVKIRLAKLHEQLA